MCMGLMCVSHSLMQLTTHDLTWLLTRSCSRTHALTHLSCVDQAKVAELCIAVVVEQHVMRLEISVDNRRPPAVQVSHSLCNLDGNGDRLTAANLIRSAVQPLEERAVALLHHNTAFWWD